MQPTLFYAWQSDADEKANRYLIRDAAERAIKSIVAEGAVEDAPRLDHDTRDASGTPEIAGTIFEKIKAAGLFLADVTLVGNIEQPNKEPNPTPNPNVMIELGYAAGIMGWDRIILVLNEEYGPPDKLPFDLKHRRFPITYKLAPGDDKAEPRQSLAKDLAGQIKLAMAAEHDRVTQIISQLTLDELSIIEDHSRWTHFFTLQRDGAANLPVSARQHAYSRMLTLGMIQSHFAPEHIRVDQEHLEKRFAPSNAKFVYTWTYLGALVIKRLGLAFGVSPLDTHVQIVSQST